MQLVPKSHYIRKAFIVWNHFYSLASFQTDSGAEYAFYGNGVSLWGHYMLLTTRSVSGDVQYDREQLCNVLCFNNVTRVTTFAGVILFHFFSMFGYLAST